MPLKHITKFCTATCRARNAPCLNPAAFGMPVCVKHGAHKVVARGENHGRYNNGAYTHAAKANQKAAIVRLALLEELGFRIGMMTGKRTPGRKVKGGLIPENALPAIAELQTLLALTPEPSQTASKRTR